MLRRLVSNSFCFEIRENFEKFKGFSLSNIFDLNYKKILNISISILVVFCSMPFLVILLFVIAQIERILRKSVKPSEKFLAFTVFIENFLFVARFILSIILLYFYEKSDIEKYDDFLKCRNIEKKFFDEFSGVTKLRRCFFAFFVLNLISQGLDRFQICWECEEKIYEGVNDGTANNQDNQEKNVSLLEKLCNWIKGKN